MHITPPYFQGHKICHTPGPICLKYDLEYAIWFYVDMNRDCNCGADAFLSPIYRTNLRKALLISTKAELLLILVLQRGWTFTLRQNRSICLILTFT